jgi:hypothetical protein
VVVSQALALLRLLPWAFFGRLAIAFTEITLSVFVVSSSVVVGHQLKVWREWFYDPATTHPWAPTPKPSLSDVVARPAAVTLVPVSAPAPPAVWFSSAAIGPATCPVSVPREQILFINKVGVGADCVRIVPREDGPHLVVDTYPNDTTDFGIIATSDQASTVKVFAPTTWPDPVLVIRTTWAGNVGSAIVLTWRSRSPTRLLGVFGQKVDVSTGNGGWPRLMVTTIDGTRQMYVWSGGAFSAQ